MLARLLLESAEVCLFWKHYCFCWVLAYGFSKTGSQLPVSRSLPLGQVPHHLRCTRSSDLPHLTHTACPDQSREGEQGVFRAHHHYKYMVCDVENGVVGQKLTYDVDRPCGVVTGSWNPTQHSFASAMDTSDYLWRKTTVAKYAENFVRG